MRFKPETYDPFQSCKKWATRYKKHYSFLLFGANYILILFVISPLSAQTIYQEKAIEVGIDHYFHNANFMGGGAAVFDFNQDGWEDIWINGGSHRDVLYQNNHDGTFKEIGQSAGLKITADYKTTSVVTGDYDNDGDRDVFITTREDQPNLLFQNNGDNTFTEIGAIANLDEIAWSTTASFADIDQDGFLDIYVGNYVEEFKYLVDRQQQILSGYDHICQPNFLYLNNQDGTFSEVANQLNAADEGCALASTFTDFDNDGDTDLMVINDYGQWVIPNNLLINDGVEAGNAFTEIDTNSTAKVGIYAMGVAIGDYDKDNDLDYYITNLGRNALLQNQGNGLFIDTTQFAGVEDTYAEEELTVGWGTTFLDIDNDSDLDLLVANGFISALSFNRTNLKNEDKLFVNQGFSEEKGGVYFKDESKLCGLGDASTGRGLVKADFDNDGDLDLLIVRVTGTHDPEFRRKVLYYENQLNSENNWLKVDLTTLDAKKYGAHLRIVVDGESWVEEINGGSSHASQHSSIVHFGLGKAKIVDSLIVQYIGGEKAILTNLPVNEYLAIEEGTLQTTSVENAQKSTNLNLIVAPNPFRNQTIISFTNPDDQTFYLKVFDTLGNIIFNKNTKDTKIAFSSNNLPNGFYLVQLQNEKGQFEHQKILIH